MYGIANGKPGYISNDLRGLTHDDTAHSSGPLRSPSPRPRASVGVYPGETPRFAPNTRLIRVDFARGRSMDRRIMEADELRQRAATSVTKTELAQAFGIGWASVYRYLKRLEAGRQH